MIYVILVMIFFGYVLNELTRKYSLDKVFYKREFSSTTIEIGEEFKISTIIENKNIFPISYLLVKEKIPNQLIYKSSLAGEESTEDKIHEMSMFVLPKQRIRRKFNVSFNKRGHYFFRDVSIVGEDFLGLSTVSKTFELLQAVVVYPKTLDLDTDIVPYGSYYGDISVLRWIISDPILNVGIREYNSNDPQKSIHWPSSLRSGQLMVKKFDFTTDNRVMIVLNIESCKPFWRYINTFEIEKCLSATRAIMEKFESLGIPYAFASNVQMSQLITDRGYIESGQGASHFYSILEILGKTNYDVSMKFEDVLAGFFHSTDNFETYVIITPSVLEEYVEYLNVISKNATKTVLISVSKDRISELNENIIKLVGEVE